MGGGHGRKLLKLNFPVDASPKDVEKWFYLLCNIGDKESIEVSEDQVEEIQQALKTGENYVNSNDSDSTFGYGTDKKSLILAVKDEYYGDEDEGDE